MKTKPLETDPQFLRRTIISLTDQIDLFETFQDLSLKIISQFDLENLLRTFCTIIKEIMNYQSANLYLFDEDGSKFHQVFNCGSTSNDKQHRLPEHKIIHWVMDQGRWTILTDFQDKNADAIISILPIKTTKTTEGFMVITTDFNPSFYNRKLGSILNFIASQTAIAIENQNLYAKINDSNVYMASMLESISNGIVATNIKGEVTQINRNASAILGITLKDFIGKPYSYCLKGNLKKEMDKILSKILEKGYAVESMVNHAPYSEVDITLGITASLLTDKNKETIGVIFSFRDMSASKEIERLTRLDEMKSEFLSNVSHELRTPLSVIKSYVEAIQFKVDPQDHLTRNEFLQVVNSETDRLTDLVEDLLDISRIEADRFEMSMSNFSLEQIIEPVLKNIGKNREKQQIMIDIPFDLPECTGDRDKLTQVFINLLDNAIRFSPFGGIILIKAWTENKMVFISVADKGIGFEMQYSDKIFEKFFRIDNSDTYEISGTGLGLSIVKHIVQAHNGSIQVKSNPGEGSIFTVSLPLKPKE